MFLQSVFVTLIIACCNLLFVITIYLSGRNGNNLTCTATNALC